MVFTTLQFICFFAAVFSAYWAMPPRFRWGWLLAASWFFYAWASPYYLIFLGVTTVCTYIAANGMTGSERRRRWMTLFAVVATVGMLVVFKYLEFIFANVNWLMGAVGIHGSLPVVRLMLPIGLSFYVFQSLGYCIDVQREVVPAERNFFRHALFVSYFPQILQGPIGDYGRLAPQFFEERTFNYEQAVFGIQRVAWGFFKKVMVANVIADRINPVWSAAGDYPGFICWSAILVLYAVQLYADFSGYMDIACGCSQMLGIKLDENFQCPYFAKSISDFWRRWHITLGAWFKNYVFYPLLRVKFLTTLRRRLKGRGGFVKSIPTAIALFVVWLLIGLWHGADWSYVAYGLFHGSFIILAVVLAPITDRFHARSPALVGSRGYAVFQMVRTFAIVTFGYVLFKPANLATTGEILRRMFSAVDGGGVYQIQYTLHHSFIKVFVWIALMFAVDAVHYTKPNGTIRAWLRRWPVAVRWAVYIAGLWLMIFYGEYGSGFEQFEYFKF
ncbi:MAG: MBOAT family protein [Kiritimatiellae bacterium]|nr:MBOAT family protein [Kiritimatiellia bacterium]